MEQKTKNIEGIFLRNSRNECKSSGIEGIFLKDINTSSNNITTRNDTKNDIKNNTFTRCSMGYMTRDDIEGAEIIKCKKRKK